MSNTLVSVSFHEDTIDACQTPDGAIFASLRRMCESMGVDHKTQFRKLQGQKWATVVRMTTVADDGKPREMSMLHVDSIPLWLATIHASKVAPSVRSKLERYQKECAEVLRRHFNGEKPKPIHKEHGEAMVDAIVGSQQCSPQYYLVKYMESVGLTIGEHDAIIRKHDLSLRDHELDIKNLYLINDQMKQKKTPVKREAPVRDKWALRMNGKTEVQTEFGFIDIYVQGEWIIEVKDETCWKQVIGQLQAYHRFDPNCRKMAVLFTPHGKRPLTRKGRADLSRELNNNGIYVWFDDEDFDYNNYSQKIQKRLSLA